MAFLGVFVMVLGGAAAATPDVVRGTWPRLVPTSVLYAVSKSGTGRIGYELLGRFDPAGHRPYWETRPPFWSGWPMRLETPLLRARALRILQSPASRNEAELAIKCVQAIGPVPSDLPVLIHALDPPHGIRYYALASIACLGPDALPALPLILDDLDDPDWFESHLNLIVAIGPGAQSAVEHLRRSLWSQSAIHGSDHPEWSDARAAILKALGAIGPSASPAIPDILELHDLSPFHRVACACALIRIAPDTEASFEKTLELLHSTDVAAHAALKEALGVSEARTLRARLLHRLESDLSDPDGCTRIAAVRALASLDAVPSDAIPALASDPDVTVRLFAETVSRKNRP
jgi:HEAT repeat protein